MSQNGLADMLKEKINLFIDDLNKQMGRDGFEISGKSLLSEIDKIICQPSWISIEDRLPDEGKIVLIDESGCVIMGYTDNGKLMKANSDKLSSAKHWMPRPKPYNF